MRLQRYREKRDFHLTPEPRGRVGRGKAKALSFVIQKHAARRLHYDFRLELGGVLLSWAVPKGPSLDPQDKRLAIHVEDHPLEYGGFEGVIPPDQYGSGTVMVWDRGTWAPSGDPVASYKKGHLKFQLEGEKLKGGWTLVRTHGSKYGGKSGEQAWLLIKEKDAFAQRGSDGIVDDAPDSATTGRSLEEIARDRKHEWHSSRSVAANVRAGALTAGKSPAPKKRSAAAKRAASSASAAVLEGAKAAAMPATLTPMLATLVDDVPGGDDWVHEIKYDGYRMLCRVERGKARIFSRNGKDWTSELRPIAEAAQRLNVKQAWLDGEVAAVDAEGHTSFQVLQNALSDPNRKPLTCFVFDLLYLDGHDLRQTALIERKRLLQQVLEAADPALRYSADIQGSGAEFLKEACRLGLEGAISKRADSLYRTGIRTRDWVKVKCGKRQEMVVGGFTDPQRSRRGFGALLLGVYESGELRYSGKVGTGFDDKTLTKLRSMLDKLEQSSPPFANPPRGFEAKGAHWVKPQLVAEIAFTEWSNDGALRHPSFQGLREDKKAADVVRERPATKPAARREPPKRTSSRKARSAKASNDAASDNAVAGVTLSHPDKQLFPEAKLAKRDLALYYEKVADRILPHLRDRPLSLVRCPDGWNAQCFYQKHADKSVHKAVTRIEVPESGGKAMYFAANSLAALVGLVQWGVIELHPWGSRAPKLDRPDRLLFDFDPDPGVAWAQVVEAVGLLRTLLEDIGLTGFLKTTGGKGLHVVVPVRATLDWDEAKGFTRAIADVLVRTFPDRFIATASKHRRKGRIFIDYLRNAVGATAIAPYAMRARANAPVSTPITWDELGAEDLRFDHFNVSNIPERLNSMRKDPWASFDATKQAVTQAIIKRVGSKALRG